MVLKELVALPGVSGNEHAVRNFILERAKNLADEAYIDRMGNVVAVKKGEKNPDKSVMMAAHMDEVGLLISYITDNGMLNFQCVGGIDARVLVSKRIIIGDKKVPGVIGAKAIHLQEREERTRALKVSQLYIDIGARSKDEALKLVTVGDYAIFDSNYIEFGDNLVKGRALDDRVGCSILLELLEKRYPVTLKAVFTVQEEIGCRGAKTAAYKLEPDCAIVLEGTTCADMSEVKDYLRVTKIGEGPSISIMDGSAIADPKLRKFITKLAADHHIPYQFRKGAFGGTDAGNIQRSRGGVPVSVIAVPCRYIHSPTPVMHKDDYKNAKVLAELFMQNTIDWFDNQ